MRMRLLGVATAMSLAGAGAARAEDVVDRTWGFAYKLPGLGKAFDMPRPGMLFSGHVAARLRVQVLVHESTEPRTAAQWRDAVKAGLAEGGKLRGITAKDRPRATLRYTKEHLGVFAQPHGHAFYPRGKHQCFEVHAWFDDATDGADKQIDKALGALRLPRVDVAYGLRCSRAATRTRKAEAHPKTLLEGGLYYLVRDPIPELAAAILRRAAREAKKGDLTDEERWKVRYHRGRALVLAKQPTDALLAFEDAARVAVEPRARRAAQYEVARCAAPLKQLDKAFAALHAAFKDGMPATKGELSHEPALALCRKDPRWERFWSERIAR